MSSVLVVYSGGLDSYTLLNKALDEFERVEAITFDYGQKHSKEITFASNVCSEKAIAHEVVNLDLEKILSGSALVGTSEIPEGNYDKEKMKQTVVPNRNMIMISVAASLAIKNKCEYLWYAAHSGDHEIKFEAPFMNLSKQQIVAEGLKMNLDYANAWTCYVGGEKPCMKCSACLERKSAFAANNIKDPLNEL